MSWNDFLKIARVRALEEADEDGCVWDVETRRAVTRHVAQADRGNVGAFLARRADALESKAHDAPWLTSLHLPRVPSWAFIATWLLAFATGAWLAALGQEREINLLALPLMGILLWNAAMFVLSLWPVSSLPEKGSRGGLLESLCQRFDPAHSLTAPDESLRARAYGRFRELAGNASLQHVGFRLRAALHIGAALLALGSITGMYARGWSKEYRAVWESTLLDEAGATKFFRVLFAPASAVTGLSIPLDELPAMRRGVDREAASPGDALPWIHLYAATLGLLVVVPRGLLTMLELSRARAVPRATLQSKDWRAYAHRLLSLVDGAGAPALILTHGLSHDTASQDRWRQWAHAKWRDVGRIEFDSVPVGREVEFMNSWLGHASRIMLIFNMSTTPEAEIQRWLVESLVTKLKDGKGASIPLLLALDDTELARRWSGFADAGKRMSERAAAWRAMLNGAGAEWLDAARPVTR